MQSTPSPRYIVVGVDGSQTALAAARWASVFAGALALPLHLVHSSPPPAPVDGAAFDYAASSEVHKAHREEVLAEAEATLHRHSPNTGLVSIAADHSPAKGLLEAAERAEMIVLGATGAGSVERWLLGSTALRVANQALCPVAVWRGDPANVSVDDRPIVVGAEGSPFSAPATRLAFEWAQLFSVRVTAVRAWSDNTAVLASDPTSLHMLGPAAMAIDWEAIARAEAGHLSKIIAPYRREYPDVAVEERSQRGSAPRQLLDALTDAQMAIVGSKGWGRIRGALLGSTSQSLLHHARTPVVIYRGTDT
ncbi:universal stress protein [Nocardia gamkensis]|uniref:Universal stress protein n=1 Tax=Nocardia gamkensis TaxID=352869 RepID=A0A7X6LBE5_9NOCA|nr:universal stress protein [Nocardia gamkensis]NKY31396.1 universal stress protein [Nocardia gamkensis]NQE72504.1 Universal stress protein [Nocardia gamkensis]